MFAKSFFAKDNFTSRRTTGNNKFDPEALLTEGEAAQGFDYDNSERDWPSQAVYEAVCNGDIPAETVPSIAPRVLTSRYGGVTLADTRGLVGFPQHGFKRASNGQIPCGNVAGKSGFVCNQAGGHTGKHAAFALNHELVATWETAERETPQQEIDRIRRDFHAPRTWPKFGCE